MKKLVLGIILGGALGAAVCWFALRPGANATPAPAPAPVSKSADAAPATNPLNLDATKRAAAGITVAIARTVQLQPEVEAFGRVLDPTAYASLVVEEATAQASLTASEKELERLRKLYAAGGNASAQAVETAEVAEARDRAAVAAAEVKLLAGWGRALTEHADLASVRTMLAAGASLIRLDLLPGVEAAADVHAARVSLLGGRDAFDVEVLGPAPVADPQVQGMSYLALLRGRTLPAGATLKAILPGPGESKSALILPQSAVVYHQGSAWVYGLEKSGFERKLVSLGREVGADVVVTRGIEGDDQIAVTGAQQLLSAELSTGGAPEGD